MCMEEVIIMRVKPRARRVRRNSHKSLVKIIDSRIKPKLWKGVKRMSVIAVKPTSFSEIIFDRKKRQETYDYYDSIYVETEDEKEIFEGWRKRRLRKGE